MADADGPDPGGLGRQLSTAIIAFHQAVADRVGLSAADHKAFEVIVRQGPMAARDLAHAVRLTPAAVTALLDRLSARGLIDRQTDPDDRRRSVISAAIPQNSAVADAYRSLGAAMAHTMAGFSAAEQVVIHRYVVATIDVLHHQTDQLTNPATKP